MCTCSGQSSLYGIQERQLLIMQYVEEAKLHAEIWYDEVRATAAKEGIKVSTETIIDAASAADSIVKFTTRQRLI